MYIKQVSIFVENKKGTIAEVISILGKKGINIRALSVADTADYGVLRLIVNQPEEAYLALKDNYTLKLTDVLGFTLPDRPNGLGEILSVLHDDNQEISYLYTFVGHYKDKAICIIKTTDLAKTESTLKKNGITVVNGNKIYEE